MNDRRAFLKHAGALTLLSPLQQSKQGSKPKERQASAAEITEGFAKADRGKNLAALLETGPREGVQSLSDLGGISCNFPRGDGSLGFVDFGGRRALSRDGGRTFEYLPKLPLPKPPAEAKLSERQMGGTLA